LQTTLRFLNLKRGQQAQIDGIFDGIRTSKNTDRQYLRGFSGLVRFRDGLGLESTPLVTVIEDLRKFLLPMLAAVATEAPCDSLWRAGTGWN
jgi:hypothetical protein